MIFRIFLSDRSSESFFLFRALQKTSFSAFRMSSAAAAASKRANALSRRRVQNPPSSATSAATANSRAAAPAKSSDPENELFKNDPRRIREYSTPEDRCPICDTTRYFNAALRLLVSTKCYHRMCESCIDRIFTLGPEPCPTCGTILRKTNFTPQTFEDLGVEKEVKIRKRMAKLFRKHPEDFVDLKSYNDYLEEVEEMTFNMVHGIDVTETEAKIAAFQRANADSIDANELRSKHEAELFREREKADLEDRKRKQQEFAEFEAEQDASRQRDEEMIMKELEAAAGDTEKTTELLERAKELREARQRNELRFLSGMKSNQDVEMQVDDTLKPPNKEDMSWIVNLNRYYDYSDLFNLPNPATSALLREEPESRGVVNNRCTQAGGFKIEAVWERSMRSAVMELWEPPVQMANSNAVATR